MSRFKRTKALLCSKVLWAAFGLILIVLVAQHVYLYFAIERIRDEIRAMGYPATTAEMLAPENNSEDQQRTKDLYDNASNALALGGEYIVQLPIVGECCEDFVRGASLSDEVLTLTERALTENSETLANLRLATETGVHQFWVFEETDDYFLQDLRWYTNQRNFVRLLALETLYLAETGEFSQASDSLVTGISVTRVHPPYTTGQLLSIALEDISRGAFEDLASLHKLHRADLEKLRRAFESASFDNRLAFAATTEACLLNQFLDEQDSYFLDTPYFVFESALMAWLEEGLRGALRLGKRQERKISGSDSRAKLRSYTVAKLSVEASESPEHQALHELQDYFDRESERSQTGWLADDFEAMRYWTLSTIVEFETKSTASNRAASTAAAIEMYALDRGELPESLSDLVPAYMPSVPVDPFDGNELRYAQTEEGYSVYSIGSNLNDDNGNLYSHVSTRDVGVAIRR